MTLFSNFPLISAFLAIIIAQLLKVIIHYALNRRWQLELSLSSGSMPSSHTAAVAALSASVGITEGVSSSVFAVAVIASIIIMFDAAGIRKHAGTQARYVNKLISEFHYLFQESVALGSKDNKQKALKELIGHEPAEVLVGAVLGILVSFFCKAVLFA